MSNADRIEELRSKYEENPRRYFAPLANEYRKAGDLAQAIAICREHLPKQPGHMSGYIVYGQTLFEANNLEEARTVFEQALTLDPENLIALKHLGDIARMNGENGVARRWYSRVLDADPRNDDIAAQLASLGAPTPIAPMPVIPPPTPYSDPLTHGESVGVFATFDPGSLLDVPEDVTGIAGGREFWAPPAPEQRPAPQHEPLDLDFPESPEPVAEETFEEGILAPEWPDTSELVARVVTPFHSATPISTPATPDTLAAFGRESFDSVDSAPIDAAPADELVDAFLPPEPAARPIHADEPVEFADSEFESAEFETTSGYETSEFESAHAETSEFAANEIITADFAAPVHEASAVEFIGEPVVDDTFANEVAVDEPFSYTENNVAEATAYEDLPWIDSAAPISESPEAAVTSDANNFAADAEEIAFDHTLSPQFESDTEVEALQHDVTAEFEIPEQFKSGAHSAFAEAEPASSEPVFEMVAFDEPALDQVHEEPVVPTEPESVAAESVAEELLAEESVVETSVVETSVVETSVVETSVAETSVAEESFAEVASQLEAEKSEPFVTETMAELLVAQGFLPRAIEVYDELVRRRPHDPVLVSRLTELRALHEAEELPATEASTHESFGNESFATAATPHFNTPIRNTPLYMTPQFGTPAYNTPHFSTLSATPALVPSFSETDATSSNASERHANDRAQAFRTARERFAELSRRRVARRTPTHATAVADDVAEGLSSLFGTAIPTTTDELAARALADAFGPVQDSGESLFDPAPSPTPALPMRSLTPRNTTPVYTPATPDPRSDKQGSDRQPSADYSFDRFFPDPAMAGREGQSAQSTIPVSSSSPPANEDLAQFSAWLKGLNNA
ncbi:MAG: tetratricopeptide repeat protein [Gemmatimonadaceae bacterium]